LGKHSVPFRERLGGAITPGMMVESRRMGLGESVPIGNPLFRCLRMTCLLAVLAGCASGPVSDEPAATDAEPGSPPPSGPVLRGKEIGKSFMASALGGYRFYTDEDVGATVRAIGHDIAVAAGVDPDSYHFFVVENPQANAFAIPGGYIFVFDGLLRRLGDEEELAGVLAHEVAHVTHGHFFKDQKKVTAVDLMAAAAILLGRSESVAAVSLAGAASMQLAYSRDNEREADVAGISYLYDADYAPGGLVRFFGVLRQQAHLVLPKNQYTYLSTHPGLEERYDRVERMIERRGEGPAPRDPGRWQRLQAGLAARAVDGRVPGEGTFEKGYAALRAARLSRARPLLEQAVRESPESAMALAALAECLVRQEDAAAAGMLERAQAADPQGASVHFWQGEWHRRRGEADLALAAYERAIALDDELSMAHFRLSQLLAEGPRAPWGRFHLARYLRLTLKPGQAVQVLGEIDPAGDEVLQRGINHQLQTLEEEGV